MGLRREQEGVNADSKCRLFSFRKFCLQREEKEVTKGEAEMSEGFEVACFKVGTDLSTCKHREEGTLQEGEVGNPGQSAGPGLGQVLTPRPLSIFRCNTF